MMWVMGQCDDVGDGTGDGTVMMWVMGQCDDLGDGTM